MTAKQRSTRSSRRHLSTDFEWEGLASFDLPDENPAGNISHLLPVPDVKKAPKSALKVTLPATTPSKTVSTSSPAELDQHELAKLQLQKETQKLEIKKLELQLQLAQLNPSSSVSLATDDYASGKSLGDLKAPQKTLHPQPWPHIYAPGEPKLYCDISLPEFCAGYLVILQQSAGNNN